jgi:ketosteroid isomerase-like protein
VEDSSHEEQAVREAVCRFYEAIEDMITGRGLARMNEAWHRTPRVTAGHPMGEWSYGWDEVAATWEVVAAVGVPENAGSSIRDLRVHLYGDVAYTTCVFRASPRFGSGDVNCTNVLHRDGGAWKLVHHHADKSRQIESGLSSLAEAAP